jgi:cell division protease FtsH
MAYVEERPNRRPTFSDEARTLATEWRSLTRAATYVAVFTSPATFTFLTLRHDWPLGWALLVTFLSVIAFRGLVDVLAHRFIPRASLYGAEQPLLEEDAVARRRVWYWRTKWRRWTWILGSALVLLVIVNMIHSAVSGPATFSDTISMLGTGVPLLLVQFLPYLFLFPMLFLFNFLILFGPLVFFGIKQMKGYEPGDADWGVKLDDVRGQAEPKEDVTRVISLWQSGEEFRAAGGKPERGLLFIGAPGTGKTMLSKAIATSFNSPIMMMPGSGFASTFMGMDVVIVLILVLRARRLARKWGGQCIIFIDEIDAVGMRRQALQNSAAGASPVRMPTFHDWSFHGPMGALSAAGDLVLETRAWREKLFESRAEPGGDPLPPFWRSMGERIQNFMMPGMMMGGGSLALNQLLVQMDGIDEPPFKKRFFTRRINTFLDATYVVPLRIGKLPLRLTPPKPRSEQIYFIGATNVPLDALDPALIRPGRMGRHIWFRTPTKEDRVDIFDLYLRKVEHEPDLDTERRRDELARIAIGYSPAMIEQVCSMALTYAHSDGRMQFGWTDIVEAMTTIESGTAVRIEYVPCGDAGDSHPRSGTCRGVARLHEGRAVHAVVDSQAWLLARPPSGDRNRGAVLALAVRSVRQAHLDARRDGRRARVLRREHRRRRRRRPVRDGCGGMDGRRLRHGARAGRPARQGAREQGRRARGGDHGALQQDWRADPQPLVQRLVHAGRPRRGRARRPGQAQGRCADRRPGVPDGAVPGRGQPRQAGGDR